MEIVMDNPETLTLKKESVRVVIDVVGLNWYNEKCGMHLGKLQINRESSIETMVKEYIKMHDGDFSTIIGCCCYIVDIYSTIVEERKAITELFREKRYMNIEGVLKQEDKDFLDTIV